MKAFIDEARQKKLWKIALMVDKVNAKALSQYESLGFCIVQDAITHYKLNYQLQA